MRWLRGLYRPAPNRQANVLRKRVMALGRQLMQGVRGPFGEYGGVGRPCQFG